MQEIEKTQETKTHILRSIFSPAKEYLDSSDGTANEAFRKCYTNNEGENKTIFLRCAVPLHVQRLQKYKDIDSLSALLDINETTFNSDVLRAIQTLLLELSLNDTQVAFIDKCLNDVLQYLKRSEFGDMLRIYVDTIDTVLRCSATAVIYYSEYKEIKKQSYTKLKKSCSSISKIWGSLKSGNTQAHQKLKGALSLLKTMEKFKLGVQLKELFHRSADSFAGSTHDTLLAEIARKGCIADQFVAAFGILRKMDEQDPQNMCDMYTNFFQSVFDNRAGQRSFMGKDAEFQQLTFLAVYGTAFIYKNFPQILSTDISSLMNVCVPQLRNQRLDVPEEMTDLIFSLNKDLVQPLIDSLGLSEAGVQDLAEVYIEKILPDLKIYNKDKKRLPSLSNHYQWTLSRGRFFSNSVRVAILVPGISNTQVKDTKVSDENKRIENEFEILLKLQDGKTHANILKLFAFNPLGSRLHFHVIESFGMLLMDRVFQSRRTQDFFPEKWIINRLLEIISAVIYLHENNIIHRDLTLNAFAMKTYISVEYEQAVLCNLQMAYYSDYEASAMAGHVADVHGKNIATRWSAPESLWEGKFDVCTDTWMFGHLIHALFTHGCEPYTELYSETTDEIMAKVVSCGLKPYKWPCIPISYHKLAASCLDFDSQNRPSLQFIQRELQRLQKELKHNENVQRKSYCTYTMPGISTSQMERAHQPERGIPDMVKKMKGYKGNKRDSYFKMREKIPQSPDPNYAPLPMVFKKQDLRCQNDPEVKNKRFEEKVEENVTVNFYDKILPKMSEDFAKKMSIQDWPPKKQVKQGKITEIKLIYRFPKARNIMDLALDLSEYHDIDLEVIYQVTSLVQQMHEKRWILVDIVGKNIYINDFKACQFRIGRMVRLPPKEDSMILDYKLEELDDIVNWLPREVIGNGEFSTGSDVYTMAMLFYEFYMALSGTDRLQCVPFCTKHRTRILSHLLEGHVPDCPPRCPEWLYNEIMIPCWDQDRTHRPSAADVLELIARKRDETRKPLNGGETLTTNNLVEFCRYDDTANPPQDIKSDTSCTYPSSAHSGSYQYNNTANPPQDIESDTSADSYSDVVAVSENVDSDLLRLSDIQYNRYDSPDVNAVTFHGEHLTKDNTSMSAFSKHCHPTYAKNTHMHSPGEDKCILQNVNTIGQVESTIRTERHLKYRPSHRELIDDLNYDLFSNEGNYEEPDDVSISDPPCYENETVLVSNIKMAEKVQSKRTNPRDTCLPTSHSVYKENPIFQSDASSPGIGWRDSERSRFPPFDAETLETDYCTNRNAEN
uniref:Uncharacterized protein LOC111134623 isoform X2 n=1 Tax=Crassostrea virginica TaxID=6565 RepID=A0A8B8EHG4_CRAVI|nr:uncharacterized protein LOC111134623 isoform X2 [Crassostrea virginica]